MKKCLFFFALIFISVNVAFAQTILIVDAPQSNATTQLRAPNGLSSSAYMRACALVLQSELGSLPATSTITQFGFTLSAGCTGAAASGNFSVYLQNTTDVAYLKGTTWSTIITGMTSVYANIMTIPLTAGTTSVLLTLSTPFVYGGGGIYVAYDWNSTGPFSSTPATYLAESLALNPGCASSATTGSAPPTLTNTPFRPTFLFGLTNPYSNDVVVLGIEALGRVPLVLNSPHTIRAMVKNGSNISLSNFSVNLNVVGPNPFSNTQVVSSLAAGASTLISFAPFNPSNPGAETVSVSVPGDQNNTNNSVVFSQSVTCNLWGQNPAIGNYTYNAVGFNTGSGIIATPYLNPVASNLTGLRGAVSTNTPSVGNNVYGVLLNAIGAVLATTNTLQITNSALGTFQTFNFSTPVALTPATQYYLGFAQMPTGSLGYFPAGTLFSPYLPANLYYSVALGGGPLSVVAANYGYFGLEGIFGHTVTISAASQSISCGSTASLTALSSTNYSWSTGATSSGISVNPLVNTVYSVSASNTMGCYASTNVSVTVVPIQIAGLFNPSVPCVGDQITFTASGAGSFTWASGSGTATGSTYFDNPLVSTNYTLSGMNSNGCAASTVIPVFLNALPIINVSSGSPSVCLGNSVALNASGNSVTYLWTGSPAGPSTVVYPTTNSIFTVTGTSAAGCMKSNTLAVLVDSFTPGITPSTGICKGNQITLSATGATTLIWSTFSPFSSITVTPAITSIYSVIGSGPNGCPGSNSTTVTVNASPTVVALASRASICKFETSTLTASGATSYSWSSGQTNSVVVVTPTSSFLYTYSVTGSFSTGCSQTAVLTLNVNSCTGLVESTINDGIRIYPNPGSGKMILYCETFAHQITVRVVDALGRNILSKELSAEETELDISAEASGIYFVSITQNNNTLRVLKVIKQ
ncbi:MAG: T9SS type A sorting domain-containing protein [bacterium]|nr:T9SS type A sorting domain-containing protein [bacterium]